MKKLMIAANHVWLVERTAAVCDLLILKLEVALG